MADARLYAPATARNRDAILNALRPLLPDAGAVLEIASGSGEHAWHFAPHLAPGVVWQGSDPGEEARASIAAWWAGVPNLRLPALDIDTTDPQWTRAAAAIGLPVRLIVCINMIHIAPWEAAEGLFRGAAALLAPGDPIALYGPYRWGGAHTAASNAEFDASLRARDPRWGVRDIDAVSDLAAASGFGEPYVWAMPANNLTVAFRRV